MPRVLISANAGWNIVNFRAGLVRALIADGHEVVSATPDDGTLERIGALGARVSVLPMASGSVSVLGDLVLLWRYIRLMRRERPDLFLGWTIKPNTYGSFAAALASVPAINNISGLGTAFIRETWLTSIAKRLYRLGLRRSATIFFQNADDEALFRADGLVPPGRTALLPGSGIDAAAFDPEGYCTEPDGLFRFLLIARLIRDKGVGEYVEAAARLRARYPHARFQIIGFLDVANRTAITRQTLEAWVSQGLIDYLGASDDVRPALARADCLVLPSYREGTSRVLLEAAAMATPAITSDVPGCRDVVIDGVTGLLCRPQDAVDLAARMEAMIALSPDERTAMGRRARADVIERFSQERVVACYRKAIAEALNDRIDRAD